jgi:hypothetical protein
MIPAVTVIPTTKGILRVLLLLPLVEHMNRQAARRFNLRRWLNMISTRLYHVRGILKC